MKIEKSSLTETYNVDTAIYDIAIQYKEYYNFGYSEWRILSVQDKDGLEVILSNEDESVLEKCIVGEIMEGEEV